MPSLTKAALAFSDFSSADQKAIILPKLLCGDHIRLKQLLINFTKNGLRSCKNNGVVTIRAAYENENELLKVQVSDTGKGIKHLGKQTLLSSIGSDV